MLTGLHSAPGGVPAGSGGLADSGRPGWLYPLAGTGILLLVAGGAATIRRAALVSRH